MENKEIMSASEIHAFGVEILCRQLETDGWQIDSADGLSGLDEHQIVAEKDGELAFFVTRTGLYPGRGRFEEGQETFETLVRHAREHGAACYYASIGIANSEAETEAEMSIPVKGVAYNVQFDGLVKMELQPEN